MDFTSIPIIVILCYTIGEIFKLIFKNNQNSYKIIPILNVFLGGLLGILIFKTNPEIMLNVNNVWAAICIGIVSGVSSTGTNQIIKQVFKNKNN